MSSAPWKTVAEEAAWTFAANVLVPRLAYRLRWPTRLGPRGLMVYIAFNTALGMAVRALVVPGLRRAMDTRQRAVEELRAQLGREPTDEEVSARVFGHDL